MSAIVLKALRHHGIFSCLDFTHFFLFARTECTIAREVSQLHSCLVGIIGESLRVDSGTSAV